MKKNAQAQQIFVIILGIAVVGFLLAVGLKWVGGLRNNIDTIDYTNFKSSLRAKIDANLYRGNEDRAGIAVPKGIVKVCFASYDFSGPSFGANPLIKQSLDSGVEKNVFFFRNDGDFDTEFVDKLKPASDFDGDGTSDNSFKDKNPCVDVVNGKIDVKLTGMGSYVQVSLITP